LEQELEEEKKNWQKSAKKTMAKKDISKEILTRIKTEKVKMRPRAYFIIGSSLLGLGFAGFFLFATLFVNRAFYRLRIFGPFGNFFLGKAGIKPFFATFPFLSLGLAILGIVGGLYILRRYEFSHKRSLMSLLISVSTLAITLGFVLDLAGFGERAAGVKTLGPLYAYKAKAGDFVIGEVKAISHDELTLVTPKGDEVRVVFDETTHLPFGSDFEKGDRVRVVGKWQGDTFYAQGIGEGGLRWKEMETPKPAPGTGPRVRGRINSNPFWMK
jgi:hypothetical protein